MKEKDISQETVKEAVENYIKAVNAKDPRRISIACHFPHFRVMGDNVVYNWETADDLWAWFEGRVSGDGWGYSELDSVSLEKLTDQKYHASVHFGRYRTDGTLIGKYISLYIVILKEGRWGVIAGSGNG